MATPTALQRPTTPEWRILISSSAHSNPHPVVFGNSTRDMNQIERHHLDSGQCCWAMKNVCLVQQLDNIYQDVSRARTIHFDDPVLSCHHPVIGCQLRKLPDNTIYVVQVLRAAWSLENSRSRLQHTSANATRVNLGPTADSISMLIDLHIAIS